MELTTSQMEQILDAAIDLLRDDPDGIALQFEIDDADDVLALVLVHKAPEKASAIPSSRAFLIDGARIELALKLVKGEEIVEQIGGPNDEPTVDAGDKFRSTLGMSGTTVREGGFWGTLCLSGSRIAIDFEGRKCALDEPFLLSNSHVFHAVGRQVNSADHRHLGTVTCLYDLEAETTFDAGIARGTSLLDPANAFIVFNSNGEERRIEGLRTVEKGWRIAKQGARTGWSEGKALSPERIRVRGHRAIYPCWLGTYRANGGDSGSPILHLADGKWYLVGIHFASGPHFHSWNNAAVSASP